MQWPPFNSNPVNGYILQQGSQEPIPNIDVANAASAAAVQGAFNGSVLVLNQGVSEPPDTVIACAVANPNAGASPIPNPGAPGEQYFYNQGEDRRAYQICIPQSSAQSGWFTQSVGSMLQMAAGRTGHFAFRSDTGAPVFVQDSVVAPAPYTPDPAHGGNAAMGLFPWMQQIAAQQGAGQSSSTGGSSASPSKAAIVAGLMAQGASAAQIIAILASI